VREAIFEGADIVAAEHERTEEATTGDLAREPKAHDVSEVSNGSIIFVSANPRM
jgi:hypothetical protein